MRNKTESSAMPRTALAVVAALTLCVLALALVACGGGGSASNASASGDTSKAGAPAVLASPIVDHVSGKLLGDEDDDDNPRNDTSSVPHDSDADRDNDLVREPGYYDEDDGPMRNFGHPASASEGKQIAALVKRYFVAAAADDGAAACSMFYSLHAEAVPEDYGEGAGPAFMRGKTCPVVMTKLFAHYRAEFAGASEIVAIRVEGIEARALLGSTTLPARFLRLQREHGSWTVDDMIGRQLP